MCPECYTFDYQRVRSMGKGKIVSFVVYHRAFHPSFEVHLPYVTAIVELDEGPRMLTNIIGCSPSEVRCDMLVELDWEDLTEDIRYHLNK